MLFRSCQDISAAGKGDGLDGARSGMWREMARVVSEVRPRFVFVENSPMLTSRGGTRVIGDLAALGYDCRWTVMGAAHVGANHQRDRMWIVARNTNSNDVGSVIGLSTPRNDTIGVCAEISQQGEISNSPIFRLEKQKSQQRLHTRKHEICLAHAAPKRLQRWENNTSITNTTSRTFNFGSESHYGRGDWWQFEPNVGRVADGVAARVDRLKAIGNGQVPLCAAEAWRLLTR